jgi:hypothetical protein
MKPQRFSWCSDNEPALNLKVFVSMGPLKASARRDGGEATACKPQRPLCNTEVIISLQEKETRKEAILAYI